MKAVRTLNEIAMTTSQPLKNIATMACPKSKES